ncbi:MAG: hypothetical protein CMG00_01315 [Candidatus Marinimicrobia bacterium]|nr:hypothetical protein [Candidatus Neomarinimicrobiota bacterium]
MINTLKKESFFMFLNKIFVGLIFNFVSMLLSQNPIDNYLLGTNTLKVIGSYEDGVDNPRDLDFHPTMGNQLWVLNEGEASYTSNTQNIFNVCVPENSNLTFTIYDSSGNGICCENGEGSYELIGCETVFVNGGEFGESESSNFNVGLACNDMCSYGQVDLGIVINTDNRGKETFWALTDTDSGFEYAKRLAPGGSTVIYFDAGEDNQSYEYRKDSYSRHFMHTASSLAFDDEGFFANTNDCKDANDNPNGFFTGPTLWSADLSTYATINQNGPLLGSHLDMLHQSPYAMGIEYAGLGNIYWVYDGYHSSIVRYDFAIPHEYGGHDHSDGRIWRYDEIDIQREEGVSSHMVLDDISGFLYIADTGNQRILKFNTNSGIYDSDLTPYGEPLAEYFLMKEAEWEVYINEGLDKPSGIDLYENRLVISDYGTGDIIIYDISTTPPNELTRINTGGQSNVMGLKIGSDNKIWYVDYFADQVVRIDYEAPFGDINQDGIINVADAIFIVSFILQTMNYNDAQFRSADINSDGFLNISDIVLLVALILEN